MSELPLIEYFRYHPPKTEERKRAHEEINAAAYGFARVIDDFVQDEECLKMAMYAIQQARMFGNQGATVDELRAQND